MLSDGEIIEEYLSQTFPSLSEQQLIEATRNLERQSFPAGSIILQEGDPPDRFYIVTRGQVEVLVETSDGERLVVSRMARGQYFGETELLRGGANMATIRAAPESEVRAVSLDRETFNRLMSGSASTRDALNR